MPERSSQRLVALGIAALFLILLVVADFLARMRFDESSHDVVSLALDRVLSEGFVLLALASVAGILIRPRLAVLVLVVAIVAVCLVTAGALVLQYWRDEEYAFAGAWGAIFITFSLLAPRPIHHASVCWREPAAESSPPPILPSQAKCRDTIVREIRWSPRDRATSIFVDGAWGSGKSTVVDAAIHQLRTPKGAGARAVPVRFDAWRHASARDLELAILRQVYDSPEVLCTGAWVRTPCISMWWNHVVSRVRLLQCFDVSVDLTPKSPPRLRWRQELECVAARLRRNGMALVIVLDEVDRCDTRTAQVFLTLFRRFLDVPGAVVIVPYVSAQLRHKALDPGTVVLSDLEGTFRAVVEDTVPAAREGGTGVDHATLFRSANPGVQAKCRVLFQEKLLSGVRVTIPPFDERDVEHLIRSGTSLGQVVRSALGPSVTEAEVGNVAAFARREWRRMSSISPHVSAAFRTARRFQDVAVEWILALEPRPGDGAAPASVPDGVARRVLVRAALAGAVRAMEPGGAP